MLPRTEILFLFSMTMFACRSGSADLALGLGQRVWTNADGRDVTVAWSEVHDADLYAVTWSERDAFGAEVTSGRDETEEAFWDRTIHPLHSFIVTVEAIKGDVAIESFPTVTGAASPPDRSNFVAQAQLSGESSSRFGFDVGGGGDVDADGFADMLVGAPWFDGTQSGEGVAHLYQGGVDGFGATPAVALEGNWADAGSGQAVAFAGDVDANGFDDIIVGAAPYSNGEVNEGRAQLFLASSEGVSSTPFRTWESNDAFGVLGASVAGIGDVNGDGYGDIAIGQPSLGGGGVAGITYVYYGSANGPGVAADLTLTGPELADQFGEPVAACGDVNGDGYDDVVIGARALGDDEATEGAALVFLGSASGLSATPNQVWYGNQVGAAFGVSVAGAGDVNADGYDDVAVGAEYFDADVQDEGMVQLFLGGPSGVSSVPALSIYGAEAGALFGTVVPAGDLNGDGHDDVIIGAWKADGETPDSGAAYLSFGSEGGLSEDVILLSGLETSLYAGYTVSGLGDINGDGVPEVAVGAFGDNQVFIYGPLATSTAAVLPDAALQVGRVVSLSELAPVLAPQMSCIVDWGDDTSDSLSECTAEDLQGLSHEYVAGGTYTVRISAFAKDRATATAESVATLQVR